MAEGRCVISVRDVVVGMLCLVVLMQRGDATTFVVGGTKGWTLPPNNSPEFNQWAEKMRFQIGDSLLFVYHPAKDSVLRVTKEDYDSCNTNSALTKYTDGHSEVKLNQSGPYYFISGNKDNCLKNEKLVVVVLADRTKKSPPSSSSPPSPLPSSTAGPTASPPSPTTTTGEGGAAPSAESHPPKNGATYSSLSALSFVASLAASLLLPY